MNIHYSTGVHRERDPNTIKLENDVFGKLRSVTKDVNNNNKSTQTTSNIVSVEQAIKELLNDSEYKRLYGGESLDNKL